MSELHLATAESILGAPKAPVTERVEVPEWGSFVFVRMLTGTEVDQILGVFSRLGVEKGMNAGKALAEVVVRAACDGAGTRIFTDGQAGALAEREYVPLERVAKAAMRLNGIDAVGAEAVAGN